AFLVETAEQKGASELSDRERQQLRDTRLAAVRALKSFKGSAEAAQAAMQIVQSEKDVALCDRAKESYVAVTGKDPPAASRVKPPSPIQNVSASVDPH